ncbi:MAG TPA: universal stress protein [Actinospica sp.]|jgi:hypothetical protein|nr:universal stress protein [Actinospica sp.]
MTTEQPPSARRVVVWTDGSAESEGAVGWAARHATARTWPMHVLHVPTAATLAVAAGARAADRTRFADRDEAAVDAVRLAQDVRRIRSKHRGLRITVQVVAEGTFSGRALLHPGDVLVTAPRGFAALAARTDGDAPVPVIVVPNDMAAAAGERRVMLLTGPRLAPAVASFAFATAADLATVLDVVRIAPQDGAFGGDYWIAPQSSTHLTESRLQAELARLRARFPAVPGASLTLRTRPWATLRTMARTTHLLVVGASEASSRLRDLLELGTCPVAVVPEEV